VCRNGTGLAGLRADEGELAPLWGNVSSVCGNDRRSIGPNKGCDSVGGDRFGGIAHRDVLES
jgi:hypothetical protein